MQNRQSDEKDKGERLKYRHYDEKGRIVCNWTKQKIYGIIRVGKWAMCTKKSGQAEGAGKAGKGKKSGDYRSTRII